MQRNGFVEQPATAAGSGTLAGGRLAGIASRDRTDEVGNPIGDREIASLAKVFTALLLADAASGGDLYFEFPGPASKPADRLELHQDGRSFVYRRVQPGVTSPD